MGGGFSAADSDLLPARSLVAGEVTRQQNLPTALRNIKYTTAQRFHVPVDAKKRCYLLGIVERKDHRVVVHDEHTDENPHYFGTTFTGSKRNKHETYINSKCPDFLKSLYRFYGEERIIAVPYLEVGPFLDNDQTTSMERYVQTLAHVGRPGADITWCNNPKILYPAIMAWVVAFKSQNVEMPIRIWLRHPEARNNMLLYGGEKFIDWDSKGWIIDSRDDPFPTRINMSLPQISTTNQAVEEMKDQI